MPSNLKYTNWAKSTLALNFLSGDTLLTVKAGDGNLFPTTGDFYLTIQGGVNQQIKEIVRVTSRSGDNLTVVRGQDGTTASDFFGNDRVELSIVGAMLSDQTVNSTDTPTFNAIQLDTTPSISDHSEGRIFWDDQDKTLGIQTNIPGVVLQVGQEQFIRVRNNSGLAILNGSCVFITGSQGNKPTISLAQANSYSAAVSVIGLATHDIPNNAEGHITILGTVRDLNTSSFAEGTVLYLSPSSAGGFTTDAPAHPNYTVIIGRVTRSHNTQGTICVKIESKAWSEEQFERKISVLPISKGGTGQNTREAAINSLLGVGPATQNKFLMSDGTNVSFADTPGIRSITISSETGLSISGSPTSDQNAIFSINLTGDLAAIDNLSTIGYLRRVGLNDWNTTSQIPIGDINGNGNLTISNSSNISPGLTITQTGSAFGLDIPSGDNRIGILKSSNTRVWVEGPLYIGNAKQSGISLVQGSPGTSALFNFPTNGSEPVVGASFTLRVSQGSQKEIIMGSVVFDGTDVWINEFGRVGSSTNVGITAAYSSNLVIVSLTSIGTPCVANGLVLLLT